jgi:peptidoglycan/LPS O-acetylase OafA/YrhL
MRRDIQFLRGIAVLTVVLYHLDLFPIVNGFLGVDVFFVISGFLITKVILRSVESGTFSFIDFYTRRAKRLLPAAYSTFFITTILAYQFLTQAQWTDYIDQLLGAVTYTENIVLPFQSGYFEEAAEAKPLLHIWSLSLEEQYYLLMPLFIFYIPKSWQGHLFVAGTIASLALCVYLVSVPLYYWRFPSANYAELAFYSLPTRAWELLSGSLVAWLMLRRPKITIPIFLKHISLIILLITIFYRVDDIHPRIDALIVVIVTALMILGHDNWLPTNILTQVIQKIGDWSYSLYLVHWPLIVFATAGFLGNIPISAKFTILLLSLIAAFLQYRFIEEPFRRVWSASTGSTLRWLTVTTLLVVATVAPAINQNPSNNSINSPNFEDIRKANTGLNDLCEAEEGGFFKYPDICSTSKAPTVAVWGDSFAMHLVPGLLVEPSIRNSLVQLTMGSCAPIQQTALITNRETKSWPFQCIIHNKRSLEYILSSKSINIVILSGDFSYLFSANQANIIQNGVIVKNDPEVAKNLLIDTIKQLVKVGKRVIIVGPIPSTTLNVGECLERISSNLVIFERADCNLSHSAVKNRQKETLYALRDVAKRTNTEAIWLDDSLCKSGTCSTKIEDAYIYRDAIHLTIMGSEYVISKSGLIKSIMNKQSHL